MGSKGKKIILFVILVVVVIFAVIFLFSNFTEKDNSNTQSPIKTLTLSKDNFVILDKGYLMTLSEETCNKARGGDCSWAGTNPCDNMAYSATFKLINFPKEIDTSSSTEITSNLKFKTYSNGEEVGYKWPDGTLQTHSFIMNNPDTPEIRLPLKYMQENNLIFCFQINGTQFFHSNENLPASKLISNEVCLDSIKINSFC